MGRDLRVRERERVTRMLQTRARLAVGYYYHDHKCSPPTIKKVQSLFYVRDLYRDPSASSHSVISWKPLCEIRL